MEIGFIDGIVILVLGFCTGIFSGFFGIGGAIILTPFLNIMGFPMANAIASGMAFTVGVSIVGVVKHFFHQHVLKRVALFVGLVAALGVRVAYPVVLYLDAMNIADSLIRSLFIALLLILGLMTIKKVLKEKESTTCIGLTIKIPPMIRIDNGREASLWVLIVIGFVVGFLKGIMGVGGAFILVPLFALVLNMDLHHAAGTSLGVTFISSLFGSYFYFTAGLVLPLLVLLLLIGSFLGLQVGTEANNKTKDKSLLLSFSLFLFFLMAGLIMRQLNLTSISFFFTFFFSILYGAYIFYHYYLGRALPLWALERKR